MKIQGDNRRINIFTFVFIFIFKSYVKCSHRNGRWHFLGGKHKECLCRSVKPPLAWCIKFFNKIESEIPLPLVYGPIVQWLLEGECLAVVLMALSGVTSSAQPMLK